MLDAERWTFGASYQACRCWAWLPVRRSRQALGWGLQHLISRAVLTPSPQFLGWYNPLKHETQLNAPAIKKWLDEGAQPTGTVENLLKKALIMPQIGPKKVYKQMSTKDAIAAKNAKAAAVKMAQKAAADKLKAKVAAEAAAKKAAEAAAKAAAAAAAA